MRLMRSQMDVYDDEFRSAVEDLPELGLVMILDDYRSLMKHLARTGQRPWADMCERRAQILLEELERQYEVAGWDDQGSVSR